MVVAELNTATDSLRLPESQATPVMATVLTAWGLCGVVWKNHKNESTRGFAQRPGGALLSRIYTPGLTIVELRQRVFAALPGCQEVLGERGRFHPDTVPDWFDNLAAYLQNYYTAGLRRCSQPEFEDHWAYWRVRLDWEQLSAFQRRVLESVAAIPSGMRLTYGEIARRIGNPAAARAVGAAIGANPWPVLVPCHRVIGAGGKLTGFSAPGGIDTKRKMLDLEAG